MDKKLNLREEMNRAMSGKPPERDEPLSWDQATEIDNSIGAMLAEVMAHVRQLLDNPVIINTINTDQQIAHQVNMFNASMAKVVEEKRTIRETINGRTGVANEDDMMELSQIFLTYMNISDRIGAARRNISALFATVFDEDYKKKLEEEQNSKMKADAEAMRDAQDTDQEG